MSLSRPLSAMALIALIAVAITTSSAAVVAGAPANLVSNPSLEQGTNWPSCFAASGWGTEAVWTLEAGRGGGRAIGVAISGHESGDRKLLQSETPECAPAVEPEHGYEVSIWYRSTTSVSLTLFRHSAEGWSYWGDLGGFAAVPDWSEASAVTPPIPVGTDRIVVGLSLGGDGVLVTDDYSVVDANDESPPAAPLIVNGSLAAGTPTSADCFVTAGWGEHTTTTAFDAVEPPADSEPGARAATITMSGRQSGDVKLLQADDAGCAPSVTSGVTYTASIEYRSTSNANSMTVFSHTAAGWGYWTDLAALPATDEWVTASVALPAIPVGVDRVSFGISISGDGTLSTTDYRFSIDEPEPMEPTEPAPGDPAVVGRWDVLDSEMPIRAIHTTLLHDGRLLLIAGSGNDGNQFAAGTFRAVVWDPDTGGFTEIATPYDMFCSGHVTLPDGKVLIAGGTEAFPEEDQGPNTFKGSDRSYYFDPQDNAFHPVGDMAGAHWYPSLTKLGSGDIWAAGGLDEKAEGTVLTEIFDTAAMSWLPAGQVPQTWSFWGTYPHMYLLDDGMLFYAGAHTFGNGLPGTGASLYDWESAQIWDVPGLREKDLRDQAGSVLLPPAQDQKVMIVGGGNTDGNAPGINLVDIIDLSEANPGYVPGPDLPGPGKSYVNVVTLPDRTVLAANGSVYNRSDDVRSAAIYDPAGNTWQPVSADPIGRNYHSTAILLPDGRVVVFGSNPADNSFEMQISVYSPPYLFRDGRPAITAAPTQVTYGEIIDLAVTGEVISASLLSPLSATHQTDTNARLVDLPIAGVGANRIAQVPDNPNLLPPGPYMVTVLNSAGVPSIASWVWVS